MVCTLVLRSTKNQFRVHTHPWIYGLRIMVGVQLHAKDIWGLIHDYTKSKNMKL
jgi:hypothetical protein